MASLVLTSTPTASNVPMTMSNPSPSKAGLQSFVRRLIPRCDIVTSGLGDSWELFKRIASELPVPGLSSVLEGVSFIEEKYSISRKNAKDLKDLKEKLRRFTNTVNRYYGEDKIIEKLKIDETYYGIMIIVAREIEKVATEYKQDGEVSAFIKSKRYAARIADAVVQMDDMVAGIMLQSVLAIQENTQRLRDRELLDALPRSPTAASDKAVQKLCHPNTRNRVITFIVDWVFGNSERQIFWLHGSPSSGKSSIIADVIKKISADDSPKKALVADFLCTRVLVQSGNARHIIPTLAASLAEKDRAYRRKLVYYLDSLSKTSTIPSIAKWMPTKQFEELLMKPLSLVASERTDQMETKPIILIIDSLEETILDNYSYESDDKELVVNLLQGLCRDFDSVANLKVIISSRPNAVIRNHLENDSNSRFITSYDMDLYLRSPDAVTDIETFYLAQFNEIKAEDEDLCLNGNWPDNDTISQLVSNTGNNFLVAQTICRMVGRASDVEDALKQCLQMSTKRFRSSGSQDLYTPILEKAVGQLHSPDDLNLFRKTVMTIVLLKKLISAEDLAAILGFKASALQRCLRGVATIMIVPLQIGKNRSTAIQRVTDVIRVHDTAFIDYMRDKGTAHSKVWINPSIHNCDVAGHLLGILNLRLCKISNISEFDDIHEKRPDVLEYRQGKHRKVNRAVIYASRFWMYHLTESGLGKDRDPQELLGLAKYQIIVIKELKDLLQGGRLLSWIAVLESNHTGDDSRLHMKKVKSWLMDLSPQTLVKASKSTNAMSKTELDDTDTTRSNWNWPTWGSTSSGSSSFGDAYDDRARDEVIRLVDEALRLIQSEDYQDQLRSARAAKADVSSNLSASAQEFDPSSWDDPVQGLKQLMTQEYPEDVRRKARDLVKIVEK
ncbi:hypothetical protein VKT23_010794 [Stygiomarasmius scandens]|uniref:Nephrocystin 3-like N-terminal domain-containing protein n=1 Tax=Marasmiellus scandens TaxID=2682957 RepID=A0ABR1JEB4_9AGAR